MSNSLVNFYFKNVYSYYEEALFSMEGVKHEHRNLTDFDIFERQKVSLLTCADIFGLSSSGKTNLLRSLQLLQHFVLQGETGYLNYDLDNEEYIPNDVSSKVYKNVPFNQEEDSIYEVEFFTDTNHYIYYLELNSESEIKEETLYIIRSNNRKTLLFTRNENCEYRLYGSSTIYTDLSYMNKRLLLLNYFMNSSRKQNKYISGYCLDARNWFDHLTFVFTPDFHTAKKLYIEHPKYLDLVTNFLNTHSEHSDYFACSSIRTPNIYSGIKKLYIKTEDYGALGTSQDLYLTYDINGQEKEVKVEENSEFISSSIFKEICLLPQIFKVAEDESIILIDNLDTYLDRNIVRDIFQDFCIKCYVWSCSSQLIATFYNPLFIDDFGCRDKIWFVNKDDKGSSRLVSLVEFKQDKKTKEIPYYRQFLAGFFEIK